MFFEGNKREQKAKARAIASIKQELRRETANNDEWGFGDPWDLFVVKAYCLNPQSYGKRIENWLKYHVGLETVAPTAERGDSKNKHGVYFEIKASYKDVGTQTYNFIQIRPWHDVHGYVFIAIDPEDNFATHHFYLTKEEAEIERIRIGHLIHSKTDLWKIGLKKEDFERWVRFYRIPDFKTLKKILVNKVPFERIKRTQYSRVYYKRDNRKQLERIRKIGR